MINDPWDHDGEYLSFGRGNNEQTIQWLERLIQISAPLEIILATREILAFERGSFLAADARDADARDADARARVPVEIAQVHNDIILQVCSINTF
jgi:hypothetical protein